MNRLFKQARRRFIAGTMTVALVVTGLPIGASGTANAEAVPLEPELLITEIVANSPNYTPPGGSGTDDNAWEYVELYNNSDSALSLNDYVITRDSYNGGAHYEYLMEAGRVLEPHQTMVVKGQSNASDQATAADHNTLASFNSVYHTELPESQVAYMDQSSGGNLPNTGTQTVSVKRSSNKETVVSARYNDVDASGAPLINSSNNIDDSNGKSIVFAYNPLTGATAMTKLASKQAPTPGSLIAGQPVVDTDVPATVPPVLTHTPQATPIEPQNYSVTADVVSDGTLLSAKLYYKKAEESAYTSVPISFKDGESAITGVIPENAMQGTGKVNYYIEASNSAGTTRSPSAADSFYELQIAQPEQPEEPEPGQPPVLLISEIVFNTPNIGSGDVNAWEYFEIYNNSHEPIALQDYQIHYFNGSALAYQWTFRDNKTIQPNKTMVVRAYYGDEQNGSLDKFNGAYNVSLTDSDIVSFDHPSGNLINANEHTVSIVKKTGDAVDTIVSAKYNDGCPAEAATNCDDLNNTSVIYKVDGQTTKQMEKVGSKVAPTPGSLVADQLSPHIEHALAAGSTLEKDLPISAVITSAAGSIQGAKLYFKTDKDADYTSVNMNAGTEDRYSAVIPKEAIGKESEFLYYYIEATDGVHARKNPFSGDPYKIKVFHSVSDDAPSLLITELVPDDKGSDMYEYIEVYNNANRSVNLKDYTIYYEFSHGATIRWDLTEDFVLPSEQAAIIWVKSDLSLDKSLADFNAHWSSVTGSAVNLTTSQLTSLYSIGMDNTAEGRILIAPDAADWVGHWGGAISQAWYNVAKDEVNDDGKSVVYEYPKGDPNPQFLNRMFERSAGQTATPGAIVEGQVPALSIEIPEDTAKPVISHEAPSGSQPFGSLTITANITDDVKVDRATLLFKRTGDSAYQEVNLLRSLTNPNEYSTAIAADKMLGAGAIEYFIEAADGQNVARSTDGGTALYKVTFEPKSGLWLDVAPNSFLKGNARIQGNALEAGRALDLKADSQTLAGEKALSDNAYLTFNADNMEKSFNDGLYVNGQLVSTFPNVSYLAPHVATVPKSLLKPGSNVLLVTAGNKLDPLGKEGNNDDYRIENIKFLLGSGEQAAITARGKVLDKDQYTVVDPAKRQKVGDSSGYFEYLELTVNLPESMFYGKAATIDTKTLSDGEHLFEVSDAEAGTKASVSAIVDNTIPVFEEFSVKDGETYSGNITLNIKATDATSGIGTTTATLDGKAVTLPSQVKASGLSTGEHIFRVTVKDNAGNEAVRAATFSVGNEIPSKSFEPTPKDNATNVSQNAQLSVKVSDPNGDAMDVSFREAFRYNYSNRSDIEGFSNSTDREPPLELSPAGETAITAEAVNQVKAVDGTYFVTNADGLFPYQRYDFKLDQEPVDIANVEVVWTGHSLPDRQVTLYTWNYNTSKWVRAASGVGAEDFELKATVSVQDMVKDNTIHVLVQDLVPTAEDGVDFSFAWASDTQYYSDSYPEIYDKEMKYVADMKDEKKISYLIHTGDLVDDFNRPDEWKVASDSMKRLEDAGVPYGVVTGNHDVNHDESNYTEYWKYFGRERFEDQPYYGDDLNNNRDHYDLISVKGQDFLIMYLGWNIQDNTVEWANEVLKKYPDRYVIIGTHEYISPTGAYSGQGEMIWNEIVAKNDNVKMVLCGHLHGVAYNVKHVENSDRVVIEMLADYQSGPQGGQGYMRFLEFNLAANQIHVTTYSAYMNDSNFFEEEGKDDFLLPYKTQDPSKQVATDFVGVNVYGSKEIGSQANVASGGAAAASWPNRSGNTIYNWYAIATDRNGDSAASDIWSFSTGSSTVPPTSPTNPTPPSSPDPNPDVTVISPNAIPATGEVTLKPDAGKKGIALSGDTLAKIGSREVRIETGNNGIVTIPSEVLKSLGGKLGDGGQLVVQLNEIAQTLVDQAENAAGAERKAVMEAKGATLQLSFGLRDKSGKLTDIGALPSQIKIELKADAIDNVKLAGIYRIDESGKAVWIGGEYANGSFTASVNQPGKYIVLAYNKPYSDVSSTNWAYDYVQELSFRGIVNGISEVKFGANQPTTRAEFVTLLARALGLAGSAPTASKFKDVKAGSWYADAVAAAVQAGIVTGITADRFEPDKRISREEMAVLIIRALEYKEGTSIPDSGEVSFKDAGKISAWAQEAIEKANALGIMTGRENGQFAPQANATRLESAKVIYEILEQLK
ncbi:S-layer homology domain-containing protein [Paenibacillus glycanilyticus]|uniref:S-layer homology domain-containing protein n=1 Tax=Paenibacillus glycanilyticus TaxID=126569 RepID=UPI00203EB201|nr:S-layer homology domain-containing protein [Paenibacillus glycanilyticus]MCM3626798.1 S-layer homology domain-containing protein [Paenibacillus glycanilyticus]